MIKNLFKPFKPFPLLILLFAAFFIPETSTAATITSAGSGPWSSTSTWQGGIIPGSGDAVIIGNGHTITLTDNRTCNSLEFTVPSNGTGTGGIVVNTGFQLTVNTTLAAPGSTVSIKTAATFNLSGGGTINCASFTIGNNTAPSASGISLIQVISTVAIFNVSGNISLTGAVSGTKVNNAAFNLRSGVANVGGTITTSNAGTTTTSTCSIDLSTSASSPTLNLSNATPFSLSGTGTNTIILNGTGATVNYTGAGQPVLATTYTSLGLFGSGIKTISAGTSISANLSIASGALASIGNGLNISAGSLTLGGSKKINGTWGSTSSTATNQNNSFFAATTGIVTVSIDTRPVAAFSNLTASAGISYGTATVTLSGNVSSGPVYPASGEIVSVTINGNTQNASITGSLGAFSINFPTAMLPVTGSPYTISYSYGGNANLQSTSNSSTVLTVNPANLTITAGNGSKSYGQTFITGAGSTAFSTSGLRNSESIGSITISSTGAANTATVGTYPIVPSAPTAGTFNALNYNITYTNGTLMVSAAPLTITANDRSKVYGQTFTTGAGSTAFTASGLQNTESIGSITISSSGAVNTAPVGTYSILPSAATGGTFNASNYNIAYMIGTLTVSAAPLTITANNGSKVYGQTFTTGTGSTTFSGGGLQNSESIGSITINSTGAVNMATVGTYPIVPSAATGGTFTASNYNISYISGTLTVSTAPLTVTANNNSKSFGQTYPTGAGSTAFTSSGLQNGESIGSITISSTGAPALAPTGTYPIVPSAATGGTFTASNYNTSYVNGTLTVINTSSSVTLSVDINPACIGTTVSLKADVSPLDATGSIMFYDNVTSLGTVAVSNSSAVLSTSFSTAGTHNLTAVYSGDGNHTGSTSNNVAEVINPNANAGTVAGSSPLCSGSSATYTSNGDAGGTWSSSNTNVATVNPATGLLSAMAGGSTNIIYTVSAGCNAPVASQQTLTVNASPAAPVSGGDQVVCTDNTTTQTLTATVTSANAITWYDAATGGNFVTPQQVGIGTATFYAEAANGTCNSTTRTAVSLTINPAPAVPGTISGQLDVCPLVGSSTPSVYTISPVAAAASYTWVVPTGTTIVDGQGTTSLSVTFDNSFALTNSQFKVRSVSNLGCSSLPAALIVAKNVPAIPAAISGPTNACPYLGQATVATYSIGAVQYATSYFWEVPAGATIAAGQGGTSIDVNYLSNFTSGSIKVTAMSNCGNRAPRSLTISRLTPSAPVAINGPTDACGFIGTANQATYSVVPVTNATSYTWTLPANVNLVSGQGTTSIIVTFNSGYTTSSIKVRSVSNCFQSGDRALTVTGTSYPAAGPISGPTNACPYIGSGVQATYTIRKVAGVTQYNWTVPAGMTIMSHPGGPGALDTIINVIFSNSFVANSSITAQTAGCGFTTPSSLTITRSATSSVPGLITGPTNVCEYMQSASTPPGQPAIYTIRKVANATSYSWTAPADATITGHPGGTGVDDTIVVLTYSNTFTTGSLTVASSNGCGFSNPRSLVVGRLKAATPGAITASEVALCPARSYTYTLPEMPFNATSIQWTVPAGASIASGQGSTSITVNYPSSAVTGSVTATAYNNCSNSVTRTLNINLAACTGAFVRADKTIRGTINIATQLQANVFPNPSEAAFNLAVQSGESEAVSATITDLAGKPVENFGIVPGQTIAIGAKLKAGVYFVRMVQGKSVIVKKIVKL